MNARTRRYLWIGLASVVGLALIVIVAGLIYVQTDSFRQLVRIKIIETVEESTGGRVELAEFQFDLRHLRATLVDFVIHGTEAANEDPLFRASRIGVEVKFLPILRRAVELDALEVDQPRVNFIVFPDGQTNIPRPKVPKEPGKSELETLVDLAVGRFRLSDGNVRFRQLSVPFSAQGENLHAELRYQPFVERYQGALRFDPLHLQYGQNPVLDVTGNLPVTIGKDRVELQDAQLNTPHSQVQLAGFIEHFESPRLDLKALGRIDLPEVAVTLGQPLQIPANVPRALDLRIDAGMDDERLELTTAQVSWGQSSLNASGQFRNASLSDGSVNLRGKFVLNELVRLMPDPPQVSGTLDLAGDARLRSSDDYSLDATLTGSALAFRQGKMLVNGVSLDSKLYLDPHFLRLDPLRIDIAGGRVAGRANLQDWSRYQANVTLSGFQLQRTLAAAGTPGTAWGANLSGPVTAEGDLKGVALRSARTNLSITPNGRGIPVRGQLTASYDGAQDSIDVGQSYLTFPASRLDFSGSMNQRMNVRLASRNLDDFRPALALASAGSPPELPLKLETGGNLTADATLMGKLSSPVISGHLQIDRFVVEDRRFDQLATDLRAAENGASISNARVVRGMLQADVNASVGLRQWKATQDQPVSAQVSIQNADLRDVLAFAGRSDVPLRGDLTASARASGTVGAPQGAAEVHVRNGEAYGEPLNSADAQVSFGGERVTLSSLRVTSNQASLDLNATFDHPPDNFTTGNIQGHVQANQVTLSRIAAIQKQRPGLDGSVQLNLNLAATLHPEQAPERVELSSVDGAIGIRSIRLNGKGLGDATADIETKGRDLAFRLNSNFAGSSIQANGQTKLAPDYPTTADLTIRDLPVEEVLAIAGEQNRDIVGRLATRGRVSGTWKDPQADLTLQLTAAEIQDQKIDRAEARIQYASTSVVIPSAEVQAGPNRVSFEGSFSHPKDNFSQGDLNVALNTNSIQLAQVAQVQKLRPGLGGAVQVAVKASGRLDRAQTAAPLALSTLAGDITARDLVVNGVNAGGLSVSAKQSGQLVNLEIDSNIAQSSIRGSGQVRLTPDYPTTAQINLKEVHYAKWAPLLTADTFADFDAILEGSVSASGPLMQPANMTGTAEFTRLEAVSIKRAEVGKQNQPIAIRNDGPVRLTATQAGIQIQNARWTGPGTTLAVTGNIGLKPETALDIAVKGDTNLQILESFESNVSSEGTVTLQTTIAGPLTDPRINGRIEMHNAAYQQEQMLNGISKLNGAVVFSDSRARIETFTAETGGGQITLTGDVTRTAGSYRFDLQGRARDVRVRTQSGVSVTSNANFQLKGTEESSLVSGDVNIRTVSFNTRTDFGSILSRTAPPPQTPGTKPGLLDAMRLNVNVRMGTGTAFRTTFAENLDAAAELTVRGTINNPSALGRITISQGEIVFFGTKYTVNEGTISFFNPTKIEPILNLSLATTARGVSVVLVVTGPVQNMNLAYQSDPPLQFSEIVALLAVGKLPTSDPVLLAHQPVTPAQSLGQMGASAILSTAIANPIAGQLQRVFGVSQLKIDPTFTSGSELPQVRLTLQQQITPELTFTYITNIQRSDPQIVRAEWTIDDSWSAIATRQENGMISLDLFYKKKFQ